jgi:ribosomal-protein-alanine N-acetyltransferase
MIRLETQRLILRDHLFSDLDAMHTWMSDPEVMSYLNWKTVTREETLKVLQDSLSENTNPHRTKYYFAILPKETQAIIGDTGLTVIAKNDSGGIGEIGYFLLQPYWGKGYATEAAQKVIEFGFSELHLHKITAGCDKDNHGSVRVMRHCGMRKEAEYAQQYFHKGRWRDRL